MPQLSKIQIRRSPTTTVGSNPGWQTVNPTLAVGELGLDNVTKELKVGDSYTPWNSLPAFAAGDITAESLDKSLGGTGRSDGAAPPFSYGSVGANRTFTITASTDYVPMFGTSTITTTVAPPTVYGVKVTSGLIYEVELLWMVGATSTAVWQLQWDIVSTAGGKVTNPTTSFSAGSIANYFQYTGTSNTANTVGYGSQYLTSRPSNSTVISLNTTGASGAAASSTVNSRFYLKGILKPTLDFYVNPMLHLTTSSGSVTTYAGSFLKVTPIGTINTATDDTIIGGWS